MSRLHDIWKALAGQPEVKVSEPKTYVRGGGSLKDLFMDRERSQALLKKYRNVYEQGGAVSQAIDSHPLYILMNGYRLESEDEGAKEQVQELLDRLNIDEVTWQIVVDALVMGDSFSEIVPSRGGGIGAIVPRDAGQFEIQFDDHGTISYYKQTVMMTTGRKEVILAPDQILHITLLNSAGKVYGDSLVGRCYDDINRDARILEGTSNSLYRHGFPKYHVQVGKEGEVVNETVLKDIKKEFEELHSRNEFITVKDVAINEIDKNNLNGMETIDYMSARRVFSALGVPGDLMGYREGTTDNTAVSRINAFMKRISTFQKKLERVYNQQIIDRELGTPGLVKLAFNDADQQTDGEKIQSLIALLQADSADPWAVVSRQQFYQMMDWNIEDWEETPATAAATARRPQNPFGFDMMQKAPRENEARGVRVEKTDVLKEADQKLAAATTLWASRIMAAVEKDYPVKP